MKEMRRELLTVALFLQALRLPIMGQHTIDFSKSTNLSAVYDAGLRPWRFVKDEMLGLNITNERIRIIVPDALPFEMPVDICEFSVMAENQLSRADFSTDADSLPAAAERAREICRALGIPTEDLDTAVETFARLGKNTPIPRYWTAHTKKGNFQVQVSFRPLFGLNTTLGRVYVVLTFRDSSKPMKLLKEPIKPPPGYEHVSMEPPPIKPNPKPAQLPDPDDAKRVWPPGPRQPQGVDPSKAPGLASVAAVSNESTSHDNRLYVWFGIAAAILFSGGWVLLRSRKRKGAG